MVFGNNTIFINKKRSILWNVFCLLQLMRKLLLLLILFVSMTTAYAQKEINWMSMNDALAAQAQNPKHIFIDMYTSWCGPCKLLDRNTFTNKEVIHYLNTHYYAVKFNAEGIEPVSYMSQSFGNPTYNPANSNRRNPQHQFAKHLGVSAYPTLAFLNMKGQLLTNVNGYQAPQQLEMYLKLFATEAYLNFKSQDDFSTYIANFKPVFVE
jgi:thioredoxin-related protein